MIVGAEAPYIELIAAIDSFDRVAADPAGCTESCLCLLLAVMQPVQVCRARDWTRQASVAGGFQLGSYVSGNLELLLSMALSSRGRQRK